MKQLITRLFLWYLRSLSQVQLLKNNPVVIGITGSAGKTSTLHAVAATLSDHESIKVSYKANSETGIPLNILGLKPTKFSVKEWLVLLVRAPLQLVLNWEKYQTYIVEMAIDSPFPPKNMTYLLEIVQPEIGIFLNARPMHSEPFDALVKESDAAARRQAVITLIAAEKGKLIRQLPATGVAILNSDDPAVVQFEHHTNARVLTVGFAPSATIRVLSVQASLTGTTVHLQYESQQAQMSLPAVALPQHFGLTIAAGVAAGVARNMSFQEACNSLSANFTLPPGRASLIAGKNGSTLLDSSYNASAQAVCDMLELLSQLPATQKIAILGDIRELGAVTQLEHETVAQAAAKVCDIVCLVGPQMKQYALPILAKTEVETQWFETASQAASFIEPQLTANTTVLVKGSQNTLLLEIAVEQLLAEPGIADQVLCRRGDFWDAQRAKLIPRTSSQPQP